VFWAYSDEIVAGCFENMNNVNLWTYSISTNVYFCNFGWAENKTHYWVAFKLLTKCSKLYIYPWQMIINRKTESSSKNSANHFDQVYNWWVWEQISNWDDNSRVLNKYA